MPFVGHLPELILLAVLALIVLGPKRMIEMGSSAGKALREMRQQLKDVRDATGIGNLGDLMAGAEPQQTPFSAMSQFAQSVGTEVHDDPPPPDVAPDQPTGMAAPTGAGPVVEGTIGAAPPPPRAD